MVVLIVRTVPPKLRGELSRWMLEFQPGVFVGHLSTRVRDKLWEKVEQVVGYGSALMIHNAHTEQGFSVKFLGESDRELVDYEGLTLVRFRGR